MHRQLPRWRDGLAAARRGNPLLYAGQYGLIAWLRADRGITFGSTLRASGTAPPVWTLGGSSVPQVQPYFEIDSVAGGTGLGQATYKWSMDGGTTYVATGVVTAAGPTALGSTGLTIAQAAGPYNIDNKWDVTVSAWADQSGNGNHGTQATAANQPYFTLAGYGGYSGIDYRTGTTYSLALPSQSLGAHTFLFALRGDANSAYVLVQKNDSGVDDSYLFSTTGASTYINKAAGTSGKNVSATWVRDGVRKTIARTFDGTHATHLIYVNGALASTTNIIGTQDPGTVATVGALYIGSNQTPASSFRGVIREVVVFSSAVPATVMLALHQGMASRALGAI